jgi:hypothetical protein
VRKAMWKPLKKKKKRRKLPTLEGRSKIKEGECLLSLGKTKEVSQQMSKVKKKSGLQTWLLAFMIKLLMLTDDWDWLFIKEKVGFAFWHMLREFWYLRLIRLYVVFSINTIREREMMNNWCWS